MYTTNNDNSVPVTNDSAPMLPSILFPNGLPKESFNNYRRGSFQDSVYGSFPPTPNNRDREVPSTMGTGNFFLPPARQNDNQMFLSPTLGGWQNSTAPRQEPEYSEASQQQSYSNNPYSMNAQTQELDRTTVQMSRNPNQAAGTFAPALPLYDYVSSWAMAESPAETPTAKATNRQQVVQQQHNDITKPLVLRLNSLHAMRKPNHTHNVANDRAFYYKNANAPISSRVFEEFGLFLCDESVNNLQSFGVSKLCDIIYADLYRVALRPEEKEMLEAIKDRLCEANNFENYNVEKTASFHQRTQQRASEPAAATDEDDESGLTMAELHEIGKCRPCAYFCHKEDGCRRGEDCTFCHMCGPEMLRARRKEKAKRIKSEMKLRKQEEKEKAKKGANDSYLNFNTPTTSTKLSSFAQASNEMLPSSFNFNRHTMHEQATDVVSGAGNPLLFKRPYMSMGSLY